MFARNILSGLLAHKLASTRTVVALCGSFVVFLLSQEVDIATVANQIDHWYNNDDYGFQFSLEALDVFLVFGELVYSGKLLSCTQG